MKIVHIELPRMFTLSVKEYLTEAAALLKNAGHDFQQFDINPNFWKWVLGLSTPRSPRDLYLPLLHAGDGDPAAFFPLLAEISNHLNDISRLYGVPLTLRGIGLAPAVLNSSYAMCSLVADNFGCGFFSNFFWQLNERLHFSDADLITLGVESPEGIFWALQLAAWLKSAACTAHICIARHAWENFTLIHHIDDLAKNPWFFGIIDSVILYQEELPETLAALAHRLQSSKSSPDAPPVPFANIAIKTADGVQIHPPPTEQKTQLRIARPGYSVPPAYFSAMETPPEHLVYCMAMVRNKCFYKKCTFCVQIAKHASDRAYEESAEVSRALAAFEELSSHGITMVNCMDEAMRPVDLQKFCDGIRERNIHMRWVGRMIAAARPNRELLAVMKRAGCTEILFGLESFDAALAKDMGKISRLHESPGETTAMIEAFLDAGLFLILSMIYEFPTEGPEARRETLASIARLQSRANRFAIIFNRFHLLHASEIYRDPAKFNIAAIETPAPENDLQYHFGYSRQTPHPAATVEELTSMHRLSLGLSENQYAVLIQTHGKALLDMAYFLDYISIGFRHRAQKDATLFSSVLALG